MSYKAFIARVDNLLAPELREAGFVGRGLCWKRVRDPFIDCVEIQSRSDNAACCVNLGEHLVFLPVAGGSAMPCVEEMTSVDCEIRARLAADGESDHWWTFDNAESQVSNLIECFRANAGKFFCKYQNFPRPYIDLKMADIDSEAALEVLPTMTKVRRILLIARVYDYLGDGVQALAWAEFGRDSAGAAVGAKEAFRGISRKYK